MRKFVVLLVSVFLVMGFAMTAAASDYYEFSRYNGTGYEYDVGSYGNTIYWKYGTAVYHVDVSVADITKKDEPKLLADGITPNPNYQLRTFSNAGSVSLTGSTVGGSSTSELWIDATYIYTISNSSIGGEVVAFNKTTGVYHHTAVTGSNNDLVSHGWGYDTLLSYGGGKWWLANENRKVYSSTGGAWAYEFTWGDMAGSHGDGMEYVNGYIFVSDMTSNYIGQWGYGDNPATGVTESGWKEWNRFGYTESVSYSDVEGMGFGALGHFWAGGGNDIYELGGGLIQQQVEPIPEPCTMLLLGSGLVGLAGFGRKKFFKKS